MATVSVSFPPSGSLGITFGEKPGDYFMVEAINIADDTAGSFGLEAAAMGLEPGMIMTAVNSEDVTTMGGAGIKGKLKAGRASGMCTVDFVHVDDEHDLFSMAAAYKPKPGEMKALLDKHGKVSGATQTAKGKSAGSIAIGSEIASIQAAVPGGAAIASGGAVLGAGGAVAAGVLGDAAKGLGKATGAVTNVGGMVDGALGGLGSLEGLAKGGVLKIFGVKSLEKKSMQALHMNDLERHKVDVDRFSKTSLFEGVLRKQSGGSSKGRRRASVGGMAKKWDLRYFIVDAEPGAKFFCSYYAMPKKGTAITTEEKGKLYLENGKMHVKGDDYWLETGGREGQRSDLNKWMPFRPAEADPAAILDFFEALFQAGVTLVENEVGILEGETKDFSFPEAGGLGIYIWDLPTIGAAVIQGIVPQSQARKSIPKGFYTSRRGSSFDMVITSVNGMGMLGLPSAMVMKRIEKSDRPVSVTVTCVNPKEDIGREDFRSFGCEFKVAFEEEGVGIVFQDQPSGIIVGSISAGGEAERKPWVSPGCKLISVGKTKDLSGMKYADVVALINSSPRPVEITFFDPERVTNTVAC